MNSEPHTPLLRNWCQTCCPNCETPWNDRNGCASSGKAVRLGRKRRAAAQLEWRKDACHSCTSHHASHLSCSFKSAAIQKPTPPASTLEWAMVHIIVNPNPKKAQPRRNRILPPGEASQRAKQKQKEIELQAHCSRIITDFPSSPHTATEDANPTQIYSSPKQHPNQTHIFTTRHQQTCFKELLLVRLNPHEL